MPGKKWVPLLLQGNACWRSLPQYSSNRERPVSAWKYGRALGCFSILFHSSGELSSKLYQLLSCCIAVRNDPGQYFVWIILNNSLVFSLSRLAGGRSGSSGISTVYWTGWVGFGLLLFCFLWLHQSSNKITRSWPTSCCWNKESVGQSGINPNTNLFP